jgi:hypothetical protein
VQELQESDEKHEGHVGTLTWAYSYRSTKSNGQEIGFQDKVERVRCAFLATYGHGGNGSKIWTESILHGVVKLSLSASRKSTGQQKVFDGGQTNGNLQEINEEPARVSI